VKDNLAITTVSFSFYLKFVNPDSRVIDELSIFFMIDGGKFGLYQDVTILWSTCSFLNSPVPVS
jgi:hypothetical protein